MIDKFFGIVCRAYYLIAIIITLCAIIWGAIEVYSYHQEPRLQSWKFVEHKQPATKKVFGSFENLSDRTLESLASTNSVVRVELTSNTESVTVEIGGKFASMSRQAQDEDIREIADTVWPKKHREWLEIFITIFLTLPIAVLLHCIAHWVIWGKFGVKE